MSNNANNFNIIITNLKNGVYIKASATVEAALVMPLYIYAVMAVTYMMQIYQIRLEVDAALCWKFVITFGFNKKSGK